LGIGDDESMEFEIVEYSHDPLVIYNDKNFTNYTQHPLYDGALFIDKHT